MRQPSFFLFVDNYSCNKQVELDGTSCQTHGGLILVGPNNSLKLTIPYIKNDSNAAWCDAPCGTVGSPQYKDGTSMAAPDPKNAFLRLWQQAGDIYGESTLRIGNRLVLPGSDRSIPMARTLWHCG